MKKILEESGIKIEIIVQIILVIITSIIALITFWGVRKSNNLLEHELSNKIRPWVSIGSLEFGYMKNDFSSIPYSPEYQYYFDDKDDKNPIVFIEGTGNFDIYSLSLAIKIQNDGQIPVTDMKFYSDFVLTDNEFDSVWETDPVITSLSPNQSHSYSTSISGEKWKKSNDFPIYVVVGCEYQLETHNKKSTEYVLRAWMIKHNSINDLKYRFNK